MGRRKITIQQITDPKLRNITYNKRKNGLIKKAAEISLLCDINLMLVFEDLNGSLVQFSRNKIRSIASFPKECNYKRVLELTAEDYPNFSKIKRHKKKQDNSEEVSSKTSLTNKTNARSLMQIFSEQESVMGEEDIFSIDNEQKDYISGLNMIAESPETFANTSDSGTAYEGSPAEPVLQFQPDNVRKLLKRNPTPSTTESKKSSNGKDKNKLKLRLNIPKTDEAVKDIAKADSKGSRRKASALSSQKAYSRKTNVDSNSKVFEMRTDLTPPSYQLGTFDAHNQINQVNMSNLNNTRLLNLMTSPNKDENLQRGFKNYNNFIGEEDNIGGANFLEFSPFNFQAVGMTPPYLKQRENSKMEREDAFSNERIINYLSHPGRSPQQNSVYTFQQAELQRALDNGMVYNSGYNMEGEGSSSKKNNYWNLPQVNSGKRDSSYSGHNAHSGHLYNFDGYGFGGDERTIEWGDANRRTKFA